MTPVLPYWPVLIGTILGTLALLTVSAWLGCKALVALRTGVAVTATRAEHRRQDMPFLYWLTVSLQFINAAACLLIVLALLLSLLTYLATSGLGPRNRARPEGEEAAITSASNPTSRTTAIFPRAETPRSARP